MLFHAFYSQYWGKNRHLLIFNFPIEKKKKNLEKIDFFKLENCLRPENVTELFLFGPKTISKAVIEIAAEADFPYISGYTLWNISSILFILFIYLFFEPLKKIQTPAPISQVFWKRWYKEQSPQYSSPTRTWPDYLNNFPRIKIFHQKNVYLIRFSWYNWKTKGLPYIYICECVYSDGRSPLITEDEMPEFPSLRNEWFG